jgi:hypothetical protein
LELRERRIRKTISAIRRKMVAIEPPTTPAINVVSGEAAVIGEVVFAVELMAVDNGGKMEPEDAVGKVVDVDAVTGDVRAVDFDDVNMEPVEVVAALEAGVDGVPGVDDSTGVNLGVTGGGSDGVDVKVLVAVQFPGEQSHKAGVVAQFYARTYQKSRRTKNQSHQAG